VNALQGARAVVGAPAVPEVRAAAVRLEVRGLGHRYGMRTGLEPIDFEAESPGAVAVTGPNGSGKSTLLRILAGLLRPSRGASRLLLDGREVPAAGRRARVGFAAPSLAFYDELTAVENLEFVAAARGLDRPRARAEEALAGVGLAARAADPVAAYSSGMRQRLRLAFARLHRPPVLLLDEPGAHLDDEGRTTLERIVTDHGRDGLVVIATNDEREWRLAGRRIELRGRSLGRPA